MAFLRKLIDLIFYSNIYIAVGAAAFALQTQLVCFGAVRLNALVRLIFFATLLIYALHRVVGLFSVKEFLEEGRFRVINAYKSHILFYTVLAFLGASYYFFQISQQLQLALLLSAVVSVGYVLPFLKKGKEKKLRLRDLNWVKIFLIALVWSYVTVVLPIIEVRALRVADAVLFAERAIFIFAITLPFDIRDLKVDIFNGVKTIPSVLGVPKTLRIIKVCFVVLPILAALNYLLLPAVAAWATFGAMLLSLFSTYIFIKIAVQKTHDYYFSGLLDGTIWLQFLLIWCINYYSLPFCFY